MAVMYSFLLMTYSFFQWKGGGRRSTIAKLAIHWIIAALVVLVLGDKTVVVLDVDIQPLLDD
jgi:hypothetical protein